MEHKISSVNVLHDKEEMVASLEAGVETSEEGRLLLHCQYFPLIQSTLYVIFLDDQVLLQALDGIYLTSAFVFSQEHLCMEGRF